MSMGVSYKMEKQLLKEMIEDMDDIINHTAGETKAIAHHVRYHLEAMIRGEI